MFRLLKIVALCLLVLPSMSCHYLRGPCGLWPYPAPPGTGEVLPPFSSADGRFRIGLPAKDDKPVEANNTKAFKWFILNIGQFQILYFDSNGAGDTPEVSQSILDKFRNQASSRGKIVVDAELSLSGYPGREFRLRPEGGGTQIERIYFAGNRVYVLSIFVPGRWSCKIDSAVKLMDTFEIIDG